MILNQVSIEKRTTVLDQRSRIDDWEVDTIIGAHHQEVLFSLVERKSRLCLIAELANKSAPRDRANYHQLAGFDQRKSAHHYF